MGMFTNVPSFSTTNMKKALFSLSFGTFALGVAEFVMMAILPYVAHDFGITIPTAGNLITAYALGVCTGGAPAYRPAQPSAAPPLAAVYDPLFRR